MTRTKQRDRAARADEATKFLEANGCDDHGRKLDERKSDDEATCLDYFGVRQGHFIDEDAVADRLKTNVVELDDIRQAAQRDEERAKALRASGAHERADEAERHAFELRQLAATTARHVLRMHEIFGEAFAHAVDGGHWHIARAHLVDAIRSADADYALKVSCAKALAEVATFTGDDGGTSFDGAWLSKIAGVPLRTAQDLIASARALDCGVAAILTGTEHGSREAVRKLVDMTPGRRRDAINAVRAYVTSYLLKHAIGKEKARRSRNVSITELRALTLIGCNNEDGWKRLISLDNEAGNIWLAGELDAALARRSLSERSEATGKETLTALRARIRKNSR